jgi:hypothetical protein
MGHFLSTLLPYERSIASRDVLNSLIHALDPELFWSDAKSAAAPSFLHKADKTRALEFYAALIAVGLAQHIAQEAGTRGVLQVGRITEGEPCARDAKPFLALSHSS